MRTLSPTRSSFKKNAALPNAPKPPLQQGAPKTNDRRRPNLGRLPGFADWGRDTFIALPGLMLATGRYDEARDALAVFSDAIKDGLVPNRFDDDDPLLAHYNTVDGSMWFVHSALAYVEASGACASRDTGIASSASTSTPRGSAS